MSRLASKSSADSDWSLDEVEHLFLEGVSWELYEHLLKVVGERPLQLTYNNGELEIMSPLPEHEFAKGFVGDMIKAILEQLDRPRISLGSTTFRRRARKQGLEPDDCFYIQSHSRVVRSAGKGRINLLKSPRPDLAIEIDITHHSIARLPIYAALGVPEIWRYDGEKLQCLRLDRSHYRESDLSLAFPKLRVADLRTFLTMAEDKGDQTAALKAFRGWLKKQSWAK